MTLEIDMLRDYQTEICEKVNEVLEAHRSVMMQMPTGTGKSVVLASLVKEYLDREADCSVLIVAHRIELIEQAGRLLNHFGMDYGVILGGKRPSVFKRVMVASVQTLSKNLDIDLAPSLVVIDEAHHALAKSYQMLWTAWPEAKFLGLTWVDRASGFTYRHRPVLRKRGFVELLLDGDVVYILNIWEERFMPYRNWEIRADERICTIGNKLYLNEEKDASSYRIKKRSDDFRMFVVEDRYTNDNPDTRAYDEFILINEAGKKLEIKTM